MWQVRKSCNLYADFETTSFTQYLQDGCTRVYLGGIIDDTAEDITVFGSVEGFFRCLTPYTKNFTDLNIYFHNLAFDVSFIIWYLNDKGYTHYIRGEGEYESPANTYDLFINMQGQIYTLTLMYNNCRLTFKDSLKKLPTNIKALGKFVGLDKLNETHNYDEIKPVYHSKAEVPEEELNYLRNDILILRKAMQLYSKDENFSNTLTSASASYNTWLRMYYKDHKFKSKSYYKKTAELKEQLSKLLPKVEDDGMQDIINKSYRGGITYVNPRFQDKEVHGISYDVNSLYPYAMINCAYPCGQPRYTEDYNPNKLQVITFLTTDCSCTNTIPFIPTRQIGKSYEYNIDLKGGIYTLWVEEFELFKQYYNPNPYIISIIEFDEVYGLFDEYINKYATLKGSTKNPAERYIIKLRLNGLGGKFGTKTYQIKKKCVGNTNIHGGLKFELQKPEVGEYYYRAISSRMTSRARCVLIRAISENFDRFIYCDTDSIYLYGYDEPNNINIHPTELGAFKFEHKFDRGKFLHTKCYIIHDVNEDTMLQSVAGCSANAKQFITFDNFKKGMVIENANLKALQVKGGVVLAPVDFTIKEF